VPRLLWEKAQAAPRDKDGFLFRKEWRKTVMSAVKKAQKAAGVPESFVPHHLRHMYASELLENGVPITDVAKFLGHNSHRRPHPPGIHRHPATIRHQGPVTPGASRNTQPKLTRPVKSLR
jgi:integrase